jgi:N-acetylglucosamine-6-phosphate deacetylase
MPTTLASDTDSLINAVKRYEKVKTEGDVGDYLVGLHLEGPYLSPFSAGAQKPEHIRDYDKNEYEKVIEIANGNVGRWSGAPEVNGAGEFAKYMAQNGVTVSIAHTDATFEQTVNAFEGGFKHITHFYSCTSTVKREKGFRIAGVIEAGYYLNDMNVEIIADGCHLPQSLLKLIVKVKGTDRVMLVTDAMRAAGQDVKESYLGAKSDPMPVVIEDGVAKLLSREAFGGSIATADRLVRTMLGVGVSMSDAIKMITVNPVKMMNVNKKIGKIEKGYIADLCLFDENVNVKKVFKRGIIVFSEEK